MLKNTLLLKIKNKFANSNFGDISFITIARVFTIIGQLVYIKIYTNYLVPSELGINAFLSTISYSLNAVLLIPLDYYQQARVYKYIREKISLKTLINLNKPILAILCIILLTGSVVTLFFNRKITFWIIITGFMAISLYLSNALRGLINNLGHFRFVSILIFLELFFKVGIFYVAISFFKPSGEILFTTAVIASLMIIVILVIFSKVYKIFQNSGEVITVNYKDVFKFSYPISIGAVLNWLQMQGYRLLLVPTGSVELVGIYSTVSGIGSNAMNAVAQIFNQLNIPKLYRSEGACINKLLIYAFFMSMFILAGCFIFSDQIITILTKSTFLPYSKLVVFGILGDSGNFLIGLIGLYFTIMNKTVLGVWAGVIGLTSMLIIMGILYFTHSISVYTVGLPIIISQLITVVYYLIVKRKYA